MCFVNVSPQNIRDGCFFLPKSLHWYQVSANTHTMYKIKVPCHSPPGTLDFSFGSYYLSFLDSYYYFIGWFTDWLWGWSEMEPGPLAVKLQSPNRCTAREFPLITILRKSLFLQLDFNICLPDWGQALWRQGFNLCFSTLLPDTSTE